MTQSNTNTVAKFMVSQYTGGTCAKTQKPIRRGDLIYWMKEGDGKGVAYLVVARCEKLRINALLEKLFVYNESCSDDVHLRDSHILLIANILEPGSAVDSIGEVRRRRHQYNAGTGHWARVGSADSRKLPKSNEHLTPTVFDGSTGGAVPQAQAVQQSLDEKRIREIVKEESDKQVAKVDRAVNQIDAKIEEAIAKRPKILIQVKEQKPVELEDCVHAKFQECMMKVAAGMNLCLVGPTGSGKTYLAAQIAKALGRPFTFNSMSEGISESYLLGRALPNDDGSWSYRPSPFIRSYTEGGVHLLDEMDASDPNLLVQVNAALANGMISVPFADQPEPFKKHDDAVIIAAMNTFGKGADRQYVGRCALDEATLNRFTLGTVEIDYDKNVERQLAYSIMESESKGQEILDWAWGVRDSIVNAKLRRVMSTRNIQDAARLYKVSNDMRMVKDTFFMSWKTDEKARVGAY